MNGGPGRTAESDETRSGHYNLCPHMRFFATPPVDGALCGCISVKMSTPGL